MMLLPFDSPFAFRIWNARRWACGARDPHAWLSRLDELQRLAEGNGESAERLVDLLLEYKRREIDYTERLVQAYLASPQSVPGAAAAEEAPGPLMSEVVILAHCALLELGRAARDVLVERFHRARAGSPERRWMLHTLSVMGDAELDPFFADLREEDFDPEGIPDSVTRLREVHAYAKAQRAAREAAREGSAPSELDRILRALEGADHMERARAADALGELCERLIVEPLQRRLEDPAAYVRSCAREALAGIRAKTSAPLDAEPR